MNSSPTLHLRKYSPGETDARNRPVTVTTIRLTVRNPGSLVDALTEIGYRPEADSNGKTGHVEYYATSPAEVDRVRNPLRALGVS